MSCSSVKKNDGDRGSLKENKKVMNYFKYWFKGYGYVITSIKKGLKYERLDSKKNYMNSQEMKRVSFYKRKFLIMTSLNFEDGKKGSCFIGLGVLKEKFKEGETSFNIHLDCKKPFKSLKREFSRNPSISSTHSIELKPILNFEVQRKFRYYVESKRWPIADKFLKRGADPLIYINKYKNVGTTPLNIAFGDFWNFYNRVYSIPFINELIKVEGVLNFKEASGKTSLVKFLLKEKKLIVEKLIQEGAVLKVENKEEKKRFSELFQGYRKEKKVFIEKIYNKLNRLNQFPSAISLQKNE